ncbi:DUF5777 family beta-barrel protein [Leptospira perolatii]|uniref:DUF5777 family beta-barrel protein n=1 Tax=Leptospira perolatii TaxID=2023191 RepID=UPI0024345028|nr:DUF5777 family beta-barrel protein [Leptospira perolatii]
MKEQFLLRIFQRIFVFALPYFAFGSISLFAQRATFQSSSLIQMPSTEDVGKKNLDLRFNHRFGNAQSGIQDLYGLDSGANIYIGADYGITDRISVGFGRISENKTYELRLKTRLLTQSETFPFTLSFWGVAAQDTDKQTVPLQPKITPTSTGNATVDAKLYENLNEYTLSENDKRSYLASFLISRRFGKIFSLQISPMFTHRNFVKSGLSNDRFGVDVGGRIKLSKRFDFTFEALFSKQRDYIGADYSTLDRQTSIEGIQTMTGAEINSFVHTPQDLAIAYLQNVILDKPVPHYSVPLSFCLDIDTGGHIFQIFVTDSRTLTQTKLLNGGDFNFNKHQYSLGFNIHRYFSFEDEEELQTPEPPKEDDQINKSKMEKSDS